MKKSIVCCELDSRQRSKSLGFAAPLYFEIPAGFFPEHGWWDYPTQVLKWWLDEIIFDRAEMRFDFMDGPFYVLATRMGEKTLLEGKKRGRSKDNVEFREIVEFDVLKHSIQRCAEMVVDEMAKDMATHEDFEKLVALLNSTVSKPKQ
jgi:hypothetical protein